MPHEIDVKSEISDLLGPPPLHAGERREGYNAVYAAVRSAVSPQDFIEEIWVRDIADLCWESLRLRRYKPQLMMRARSEVMASLLERLVREEYDEEEAGEDEEGPYYTAEQAARFESRACSERNRLLDGWLTGNREITEELRQLLATIGYDFEVVEAEAFRSRLDDFERFDRSIDSADGRRSAALREIERRRADVARRMRDAIADVEDAEFEDVIPGSEAAE